MADPQKPRVPRGPAIPWTDADLDAFTDPAALAAAADESAAAWRKDARPADRGMIDAPETPPDRA